MNPLNFLKYIFTIIGAAMLVGTYFIYKEASQFINQSIETKGTVVEFLESRSDNSVMYRPVIEFINYDGEKIEFISSISSNPPQYKLNEQVKVIYSPQSPNDAKIKGFFSIWGGTLILGSMGLVFFLFGAGIIAFDYKKRKELNDLRHYGRKIETDFQTIIQKTFEESNGTNLFAIVSQWQNPKTSKIHVFISDGIWFDPTEYIKSDKINVIIDPRNLKNYLVDLSFLPEVAD